MKQFMVMCAVLPLLLIVIVQMSIDQITSFRLSAANQIIYSYAEKAKQNGAFDYDHMKAELSNKLSFKTENIECGTNERTYFRGELIPYWVRIKIDNVMISLQKDNDYYYVIDSCVASELI